MASYKTAFGSFLRHEDLQGKEIRVVIASVTQEEIKGDNGMEKKLVARFAGKDKAMILNLTNCEALSHISGTDDYDEWPGVSVVLYTDTNVKFGSKTVSGKLHEAVARVGCRHAQSTQPIYAAIASTSTVRRRSISSRASITSRGPRSTQSTAAEELQAAPPSSRGRDAAWKGSCDDAEPKVIMRTPKPLLYELRPQLH